jgi:hypothetical protein
VKRADYDTTLVTFVPDAEGRITRLSIPIRRDRIEAAKN